jgi:hypothetical protein
MIKGKDAASFTLEFSMQRLGQCQWMIGQSEYDNM